MDVHYIIFILFVCLKVFLYFLFYLQHILKYSRDFPGIQRLRLHVSNVEYVGSIPGPGTKIPHATQRIQNKQINENTPESVN